MKKKEKPLPFIGLEEIKSRPLDRTQLTSTTKGFEVRSTIGIRGLFRNLYQRLQSKGNESSHTLMMRGVLPEY